MEDPGNKGSILKTFASAAVTTAFLTVAAALLVAVTGVNAQTRGDWVLGNYRNAGYWFPGVIEKNAGGVLTLRYDDGETEVMPVSSVRPYNWTIGMKVQCDYKGKGDWFGATIVSLAGERIGLLYDDGEKEVTKTGRCRSE